MVIWVKCLSLKLIFELAAVAPNDARHASDYMNIFELHS